MENQTKEIRDLIAEESRSKRIKVAKQSDLDFIEFLKKENRALNSANLSDVIKNSDPKVYENLIAKIALQEIRKYVSEIAREYGNSGLVATECNNFEYVSEDDIKEISVKAYQKAINTIALKTIVSVFPKLTEVRAKRKEEKRREKVNAAYYSHFVAYFEKSGMTFDNYMQTIAPSIPKDMIVKIAK